MNYPRIKKGAFIVAAILVVGGALLLSDKSPTQKTNSINILSGTSSTATSVSSIDYKKDSDSDGLPDWEETLWGTDETNPDTDGDTTADGAEVKLGRNPIVKGPKDKLQDAPLSATTTTEKLSETDKFGREIFARYMNLRQSGLSSDVNSQDQLIKDLVAASDSVGGAYMYLTSEIKVNASATLKDYANSIASVLQKNAIKTRNEVAILNDAVVNEDAEAIKELDPIIKSYSAILKGLIEIRVPSNMVNFHLDFVNTMSNILYTAKSFRSAFSDPVLSLRSLGQYQPNIDHFSAILTDIQEQLTVQEIKFGPSEPGLLFLPKK